LRLCERNRARDRASVNINNLLRVKSDNPTDTPSPDDELQRALQQNKFLADLNERLRLELLDVRARRDELEQSLSWRVTAPLRFGADILIRTFQGKPAAGQLLPLSEANYQRWLRDYGELGASGRSAARAYLEKLARRPVISLVLAVHDPEPEQLRATIESVRGQIYPAWQLAIADDASTAPHVTRSLGNYGSDPRVRVVRRNAAGGVVAALNDALSLAQGDFVAFLTAGDVLAESALLEIASEIDSFPASELFYTDEDRIDEQGRRSDPRFKTGWNPDLLLAQNYLGRLTVYSRALIDRAGGLRAEYEGAHEHDLSLRAAAATDAARIRHIPVVLCHGRSAGQPIVTEAEMSASRRAVQDYLRIRGMQANVVPAPGVVHCHRVVWPSLEQPRVSIIIPTHDRADLLERCVEGILHKTDYLSVEVILVDNDSQEARVLEYYERLRSDARVRLLPYAGKFNWSAMNNAAVEVAQGEILVLLNNDTEVIDAQLLRELASQAARPEVGAVGAKLLFADGSVQHAGVWFGQAGKTRHPLRLSARNDPGYLDQLLLTRNVSAVTGACMALRRSVFLEAGGFDASLPVAYNDLDLCLRLIDLGYRIVWTPYAELLHLESASRGDSEWRRQQERAEWEKFRQRWGSRVDDDPFFNPNLDLMKDKEEIALAFRPRWRRPWER